MLLKPSSIGWWEESSFMGINLFHICKRTLLPLLNTKELLTCMELCSCLDDQVLNYLLSFDDSIQHCTKWGKNLYSFIVGHNEFWGWVFPAFFLSESTSAGEISLCCLLWNQCNKCPELLSCLCLCCCSHIQTLSLPDWLLLGISLLRVAGEEWEGWDLNKCSKWLRTER